MTADERKIIERGPKFRAKLLADLKQARERIDAAIAVLESEEASA